MRPDDVDGPVVVGPGPGAPPFSRSLGFATTKMEERVVTVTVSDPRAPEPTAGHQKSLQVPMQIQAAAVVYGPGECARDRCFVPGRAADRATARGSLRVWRGRCPSLGRRLQARVPGRADRGLRGRPAGPDHSTARALQVTLYDKGVGELNSAPKGIAITF